MKRTILKYLKRLENTLDKDIRARYPDIREEAFWDIYFSCKPYTMTSVERMYALYNAVEYVLENGISGDFVECGVWRGGSAMLVARMLRDRNVTDRVIYLYDTFEGMSEPGTEDVDFKRRSAAGLLRRNVHRKETSVWCLADLEDVQNNLAKTRLPGSQIRYIKGTVETTIPNVMPDRIALLRLDTDWYASTKHELTHLYPNLARHGVLIIDDYGHWEGCRRAVDEYFEDKRPSILWSRIDYTGRMGLLVVG